MVVPGQVRRSLSPFRTAIIYPLTSTTTCPIGISLSSCHSSTFTSPSSDHLARSRPGASFLPFGEFHLSTVCIASIEHDGVEWRKGILYRRQGPASLRSRLRTAFAQAGSKRLSGRGSGCFSTLSCRAHEPIFSPSSPQGFRGRQFSLPGEGSASDDLHAAANRFSQRLNILEP
jgi:hypothetical protein